MKKSTIASLVGLALSTPVLAEETISLDDVTVKTNRFERKDTETTYASEIHTAKQIENSGAATLYDYLAQQTSLNVLSSFGSKATPSINLRGYGGENGAQNVIITVDGQRLNNIDGQPPLLSAITLANIDRIEISKGSGSVIYGDGATAGTIQIYTKNKTGVTVSTSLGNYGQQNHYINAGISEQYFDLSASATHDSHDGFSKKDASGNKDEFTTNTQNIKLKIKPTDNLRLIAEATSSTNDVRYVNYLSRAEFNNNPRSSGKPNYLQQDLNTNQWRVGAEYDINSTLKLSYMHYREDKHSQYAGSSGSDYDYDANDLTLNFNHNNFSAIVGYQNFDGDRRSSDNTTTKNNEAFFLHTEFLPNWLNDRLTLSAGVRNEKVKYRYKTAGTKLSDSEDLNAWDIGANYRISNETSVFANYNQAFQAPDIDRFFAADYSNWPIINTAFNGFISPMKVRTINVGLNHVTTNNRFKATVFHSNLNDEFFLVKPSYDNRNIDKSHKYGLEIQDTFKFNNQFNTSLIYNYTRAIIDKEDDEKIIRNKDLPGAPKHTIVLNFNYNFYENAYLNINHTWRSSTYAFDDFQNNFDQKQKRYESTNVAVNYQYRNMNFFTSISNIFEKENSIQVTDNAIYPVDFVRTWRVGMKADF
jgi:iron complex outermembrane receptor protein